MPLREAGRAAIQRGVDRLESFNHGNVSGTDTAFYGVGILPEPWRALYQADVAGGNVRYVVRSYDTPIAWRIGDGWIIPSVRYSNTTSNHQSVVSVAATNPGHHDRQADWRTTPGRWVEGEYTNAPTRDDVNYDTDYDTRDTGRIIAEIDAALAEVAAEGWTSPYTDPHSPALALA